MTKKVKKLECNDSAVELQWKKKSWSNVKSESKLGKILVKCRDTTLNPNFLKIPSKVCNVSTVKTFLDLLKNNRIDTVATITLINSVKNVKVSKSQKEINNYLVLISLKKQTKICGKYFLDSASTQRYTYRVHQTIQMKLILLCVWAEPAILGITKTALKLKYENKIGLHTCNSINQSICIL